MESTFHSLSTAPYHSYQIHWVTQVRFLTSKIFLNVQHGSERVKKCQKICSLNCVSGNTVLLFGFRTLRFLLGNFGYDPPFYFLANWPLSVRNMRSKVPFFLPKLFLGRFFGAIYWCSLLLRQNCKTP